MEDGEACSNTDGEDNGSSIAGVDSTTDGESELGSPMPPSALDCHPHHHSKQHPLLAQGGQATTLGSQAPDIMDRGPAMASSSLAAGPIGSVVSSSMVLAT